jgi:hypothetical protein
MLRATGSTLHQLLRNVLVQYFLHRQGDDDFVAALEKGFDLLQRVRRIIERHEEAFLAIAAHHHGLEGINVRAAGLVLLFYLDGIPAFFQAEFAFLLLARRGAGGNGEDAATRLDVQRFFVGELKLSQLSRPGSLTAFFPAATAP